MMSTDNKIINELLKWIEFVILSVSLITFLYWFSGKGLFYSELRPVLSPFTSISLVLLIIPRIAVRLTNTWSHPMTLSLIGIVLCGNLCSLFMQVAIPDLFFLSMPKIVPTSAITSVGIMLFCFYEILILLRKTPKSAFVLDDILLHLALFPGALSLLGHIGNVSVYMSSSVDLRVGVSYLEMLLMASYAVMAFLSNPNLFLWRFLASSKLNKIIFAALFINQYVISFIFVLYFRPSSLPSNQIGIEFYILVAGVLATLMFLSVHALNKDIRNS